MNFRIIHYLLLMIVAACGVKGDPSAPQSVVVPSLMENYPDVQIEHPLQDNKKFR